MALIVYSIQQMYIGYIKKGAGDSLDTSISESSYGSNYTLSSSYLPGNSPKNKAIKPITIFDQSCWKTDLPQSHHKNLQIQIEQLKEENMFLKKKIEELTRSQAKEHIKTKNAIQKQINELSIKGGPLHLTISFLEDQINNLLKSICQLFYPDTTTSNSKKINDLIETKEDAYPFQKFRILTTQQLKQSIQKIMLEAQHNKFQKIIDLFANYYKAKEDSDKWLGQAIDRMRIKVNHLNQSLVGKDTHSIPKKPKEGLVFQNSIIDISDKETPLNSLAHQRNKSSITVNKPQTGLKLFRRTNKPPF